MDFLKNNKTLLALGLTLLLVLAGAVFKVDVGALLKDAGAINKEVTTLLAEPTPPPAE